MTTETTTPNGLAPALAAFQAEMPSVPKNKTAKLGTYSYKYADLADVSAAAMPLLASNGLSFSSCPRPLANGGYELVGVLLHSSGERLEGSLPISGRTPQEIGSSLTYMRRYLLGCLTGLVTDNDDDGQTATRGAAKKTAERPARPTTPPAETGEMMTAKTRSQMFALFGERSIPDDAQLAGINRILGTEHMSRADLTEAQAKQVIASLRQAS